MGEPGRIDVPAYVEGDNSAGGEEAGTDEEDRVTDGKQTNLMRLHQVVGECAVSQGGEGGRREEAGHYEEDLASNQKPEPGIGIGEMV